MKTRVQCEDYRIFHINHTCSYMQGNKDLQCEIQKNKAGYTALGAPKHLYKRLNGKA